MKPEELKYAKSHEWIKLGDEAVVGVSDYAQHEMGDVVFVELPKVGQKVEKEKQCAVVESVKSAFDILSPVSGTITAVNEAVAADPAILNQSPLDEGWLFKLKPENPADAETLLTWEQYQVFIKQA
ncbi:MAG: glycine cleavage system protein GcvH [Elusimicrobiales bacterium]|jgi:glycine cleavage system H protein|nr:glycine cleavage system protein GcvH [Elusimicrobiales bacterium]